MRFWRPLTVAAGLCKWLPNELSRRLRATSGTVPLPGRFLELLLCELEVDTLDGRGTLNGPSENRRQGLLALEIRIELGEGLGLHKAILIEKPP